MLLTFINYSYFTNGDVICLSYVKIPISNKSWFDNKKPFKIINLSQLTLFLQLKQE